MPSTGVSGSVVTISNVSAGNVIISYTGTGGSDGPTTLGPQQSVMLIADQSDPSYWRQYFGSPGFVSGGAGFGPTTFTSLTATTITETSSIALKENFRPIENPLDKLLQLVGVVYDRKDGSNKNEIGLVSEDVEKIIPELVKNDSVAYTRLTVYLLESVKILAEEIDRLKAGK